jgi:hypothetical protein
MEHQWTSQEKGSIWSQWCADDHLDDIVRAERIASRGVEIYLARIKPSGQVAEDAVALTRIVGPEEIVCTGCGHAHGDSPLYCSERRSISSPDCGCGAWAPKTRMADERAALSRLAAGAQEAEALWARVAELERLNRALGEHATEARAERGAAQAEVKSLMAEIDRIHTAVFTGMDEPMGTDTGRRVVEEVDLLKRRAAEIGELARRYRDGRTEARARAETAERKPNPGACSGMFDPCDSGSCGHPDATSPSHGAEMRLLVSKMFPTDGTNATREEPLITAHAEVERLKGLLDLAQRKTLKDTERIASLESRLAAIREMGARIRKIRMGDGEIDAALHGNGDKMRLDRLIKDLLSLTSWLVLEGDAPQEANGAEWICPNGHRIALLPNRTCADCGKKMVPRTKGSAPTCPHENPTFTATGCGQCEAERSALLIWRYPCSPTCTHDDNVNPGHPERVRQRSKAVKEATDPVGALAKEAGAKPGREVASYRCGYEQACDDMRAACWEAIQPKLEALGVDEHTREFFKRAIEGAAP